MAANEAHAHLHRRRHEPIIDMRLSVGLGVHDVSRSTRAHQRGEKFDHVIDRWIAEARAEFDGWALLVWRQLRDE